MLFKRLFSALTALLPACAALAAPDWFADLGPKIRTELVAKHGKVQEERIDRGLRQVAGLWRAEDGDAAAFSEFVKLNFAGDQPTLDALFTRFQRRLEVIDGHLTELGYEFRLHTDLDRGAILPIDEAFAAFSLGAHVNDDLFANKIAFTALLNFPLTTLHQRLNESANWTRRQWAELRLASRFEQRLPSSVLQEMAKVYSDAQLYIGNYNIWVHHLVDSKGERLFAPGLKLISHWNLRDEIKAQYSAPSNGLKAQRTLQKVMERIIDQSIPAITINNPAVDWNPFANSVSPAAARDSDAKPPVAGELTTAREPDTRYAMLLAAFRANRKVDAFSPTVPSHIQRRFDIDRQMSEARVKAMLEAVLSAPELAKVGKLISERLGRPLEPFDIWYNGFRPRGSVSEAELDALTQKRFPNAESFKTELPRLLQDLGFSEEKARYLQTMIDVEPARGSGHAMGGAMRGQLARLRTRVGQGGMDYKGFNIAVHELGHNIEQTFSQNLIDHSLLAGVPNTAFTEALAMLLQSHDLRLLGKSGADSQHSPLATINDYWQTAEIGAVALVDIAVWHWMYAHPDATPADLREAVIGIAKDVWNRFFAPVVGVKDVTLLAIYSHMIDEQLYLPDYPIGHLIQFQISEHVRKSGKLAEEFERMCRFGNLPPDVWMKNATGSPVSADALIEATRAAFKELGR